MDAKYSARIKKALDEVQFVQTLLGPHVSAESVLAAEVRRLHGVTLMRVRAMVQSWRDIAASQRAHARYWREQGEAFAWHAVRADAVADSIETQATILASLLWTDVNSKE